MYGNSNNFRCANNVQRNPQAQRAYYGPPNSHHGGFSQMRNVDFPTPTTTVDWYEDEIDFSSMQRNSTSFQQQIRQSHNTNHAYSHFQRGQYHGNIYRNIGTEYAAFLVGFSVNNGRQRRSRPVHQQTVHMQMNAQSNHFQGRARGGRNARRQRANPYPNVRQNCQSNYTNNNNHQDFTSSRRNAQQSYYGCDAPTSGRSGYKWHSFNPNSVNRTRYVNVASTWVVPDCTSAISSSTNMQNYSSASTTTASNDKTAYSGKIPVSHSRGANFKVPDIPSNNRPAIPKDLYDFINSPQVPQRTEEESDNQGGFWVCDPEIWRREQEIRNRSCSLETLDNLSPTPSAMSSSPVSTSPEVTDSSFVPRIVTPPISLSSNHQEVNSNPQFNQTQSHPIRHQNYVSTHPLLRQELSTSAAPSKSAPIHSVQSGTPELIHVIPSSHELSQVASNGSTLSLSTTQATQISSCLCPNTLEGGVDRNPLCTSTTCETLSTKSEIESLSNSPVTDLPQTAPCQPIRVPVIQISKRPDDSKSAHASDIPIVTELIGTMPDVTSDRVSSKSSSSISQCVKDINEASHDKHSRSTEGNTPPVTKQTELTNGSTGIPTGTAVEKVPIIPPVHHYEEGNNKSLHDQQGKDSISAERSSSPVSVKSEFADDNGGSSTDTADEEMPDPIPPPTSNASDDQLDTLGPMSPPISLKSEIDALNLLETSLSTPDYEKRDSESLTSTDRSVRPPEICIKSEPPIGSTLALEKSASSKTDALPEIETGIDVNEEEILPCILNVYSLQKVDRNQTHTANEKLDNPLTPNGDLDNLSDNVTAAVNCGEENSNVFATVTTQIDTPLAMVSDPGANLTEKPHVLTADLIAYRRKSFEMLTTTVSRESSKTKSQLDAPESTNKPHVATKDAANLRGKYHDDILLKRTIEKCKAAVEQSTTESSEHKDDSSELNDLYKEMEILKKQQRRLLSALNKSKLPTPTKSAPVIQNKQGHVGKKDDNVADMRKKDTELNDEVENITKEGTLLEALQKKSKLLRMPKTKFIPVPPVASIRRRGRNIGYSTTESLETTKIHKEQLVRDRSSPIVNIEKRARHKSSENRVSSVKATQELFQQTSRSKTPVESSPMAKQCKRKENLTGTLQEWLHSSRTIPSKIKAPIRITSPVDMDCDIPDLDVKSTPRRSSNRGNASLNSSDVANKSDDSPSFLSADVNKRPLLLSALSCRKISSELHTNELVVEDCTDNKFTTQNVAEEKLVKSGGDAQLSTKGFTTNKSSKLDLEPNSREVSKTCPQKHEHSAVFGKGVENEPPLSGSTSENSPHQVKDKKLFSSSPKKNSKSVSISDDFSDISDNEDACNDVTAENSNNLIIDYISDISDCEEGSGSLENAKATSCGSYEIHERLQTPLTLKLRKSKMSDDYSDISDTEDAKHETQISGDRCSGNSSMVSILSMHTTSRYSDSTDNESGVQPLAVAESSVSGGENAASVIAASYEGVTHSTENVEADAGSQSCDNDALSGLQEHEETLPQVAENILDVSDDLLLMACSSMSDTDGDLEIVEESVTEKVTDAVNSHEAGKEVNEESMKGRYRMDSTGSECDWPFLARKLSTDESSFTDGDTYSAVDMNRFKKTEFPSQCDTNDTERLETDHMLPCGSEPLRNFVSETSQASSANEGHKGEKGTTLQTSNVVEIREGQKSTTSPSGGANTLYSCSLAGKRKQSSIIAMENSKPHPKRRRLIKKQENYHFKHKRVRKPKRGIYRLLVSTSGSESESELEEYERPKFPAKKKRKIHHSASPKSVIPKEKTPSKVPKTSSNNETFIRPSLPARFKSVKKKKSSSKKVMKIAAKSTNSKNPPAKGPTSVSSCEISSKPCAFEVSTRDLFNIESISIHPIETTSIPVPNLESPSALTSNKSTPGTTEVTSKAPSGVKRIEAQQSHLPSTEYLRSSLISSKPNARIPELVPRDHSTIQDINIQPLSNLKSVPSRKPRARMRHVATMDPSNRKNFKIQPLPITEQITRLPSESYFGADATLKMLLSMGIATEIQEDDIERNTPKHDVVPTLSTMHDEEDVIEICSDNDEIETDSEGSETEDHLSQRQLDPITMKGVLHTPNGAIPWYTRENIKIRPCSVKLWKINITRKTVRYHRNR